MVGEIDTNWENCPPGLEIVIVLDCPTTGMAFLKYGRYCEILKSN
jgi:hypothetical protein